MPDPANGGVRTPLTTLADQIRYNLQFGSFSPGTPITPAVQQPVRGWDFPVNFNANQRPRPYDKITFAQLRSFANVELVRMAIETRKDQLESQEWVVKPRDNKAQTDDRCAALTKFFAKPDGITPFPTFVRTLAEDLLAIDAPCMELMRTRGGKLIGLEIVPGDTISPKVDYTGRIPKDPDALAYQQVIKGVVWNDLTRRDVLYLPRNVRTGHVYGFGPVEQIIVTINTIIRRQAMQLSHFTASNVPAGLINGPDGWQSDKLAELQKWLDDAVGGLQSEQSKLLFVPAGAKYQALKDSPIKDDFDEWLARVVAYAFSLPPTPFIRQMNKGTAGEDQERALEEGLEPLILWVKRWVDHILETEFDAPDLEFVCLDTPTLDPAVQNAIEDKDLRNGSATIDEIRDARGKDPLPDGLGAEPLIYTASGIVRLRDALEKSKAPPQPIPPALAAHAAGGVPAITAQPGEDAPQQAPAEGKPAKSDLAAQTEKLAKAAGSNGLTVHRKAAKDAAASIKAGIAKVFAKAAPGIAKQVKAKLDASTKEALAKDLSNAPSDTDALLASKIAAKIDLSSLIALASAIEPDLVDFASKTAALTINSFDDFDPSDDLVDQVFDGAVEYARARAADLVSLSGDDSLVDSTRDMIRKTIADGLEDNIGTDEIAKAVQESTAFSEDRAQLIARTEVAMANENGKLEGWRGAQSAGLTLAKSWLNTTAGAPCCDDCAANADAGEIGIDDAFPSGDVIAPAHPYCQCATTAHTVDPTESDANQEDN